MTEQTYTIDKIVGEPRTWDSKYGPMNSYKLQITGGGLEGAVVELSQKPTTTPPQVGDSLTGEIQPATDERFPAKFKKAQPAGGFGGGGGGGNWRPRDPAEQKSIQAQTAQKTAAEIVSTALAHGQKAEDVDKWVREVAARLFAQIEDLKGA